MQAYDGVHEGDVMKSGYACMHTTEAIITSASVESYLDITPSHDNNTTPDVAITSGILET